LGGENAHGSIIFAFHGQSPVGQDVLASGMSRICDEGKGLLLLPQ
jgi:hypothetical protein